MANISFLSILRRNAGTIAFVGILASAAAMAFVFLTGADYEVRTDYLVSQEGVESKDYYTVARSAEYMGKILGEVMYSEKFMNAAVETGKMSQDFFPAGKQNRLKAWSAAVKVKKQLDLGILSVTVLHDNDREAMRVSQAISQVLVEKNNLFLGTGEKPVPVSILSGPIIERNPSMKEVLAAVFGGFFFGALLASLVVFFRQEVLRKERGAYEA